MIHRSSVIIKVDARSPQEEVIQKACAILKKGGLVAFPTETFYGLGADALNDTALAKIFTIKRRPRHKPLLVIISQKAQLRSLVSEIPPLAEKLMEAFWPGPLTMIFKARSGLPALLTGGTDTVGVRMSSHPVARHLSAAFGFPLTATSANVSGGKNPLVAQDVCNQLGQEVDVVLDGGKTGGVKGSTIIDLTVLPPRIVREGDIPVDEVEKIVISY